MFAQNNCPPISEHGEISKLMSGISLSEGGTPIWNEISCQKFGLLLFTELTQVDTHFFG